MLAVVAQVPKCGLGQLCIRASEVGVGADEDARELATARRASEDVVGLAFINGLRYYLNCAIWH